MTRTASGQPTATSLAERGGAGGGAEAVRGDHKDAVALGAIR
ncbi:hypothetical protein ACWELO_05375 [Streptomyces sp. NPDC004596]